MADREVFVARKTDAWGVAGALVTLGDPNKSNPYLALAGIAPLDGSQLPQIDADPDGRHANKAELEMVAIWITNNALA